MARVTKAIIPVAGYGTRRLPMTKAIEKSMLPIGDRPLVDYAVSECIQAGIKDIYFVINKSAGDCPTQIETYYGRNMVLEEFLKDRKATEKLAKLQTAPEDVRFHYIVQDPNARYGTAIPVALFMEQFGADLAEDEGVAFANGDDFFWDGGKTYEMVNLVAGVRDGESATMPGLRRKEEMPSFGMVEVEGDYMIGLVEKPALEDATSLLANTNRCIFNLELLKMIADYVDRNDFSPLEQEYMITDPILEYVRKGGKMRVVVAQSEWLDGGSLDGWFKANQVVLGK
ncbi:sugar phosphate nucleotidyltransferase [Candidatus Saccharibacteria bacterium]|nr:sugar phosphate nucleotidyltransferase [Candidatus Saccharibacteria bacterium]